MMKFKIFQSKERNEIDVFIDVEPTTMEALVPNSMIIAIIEPRSVWNVNGNFGVTFIVRQAKIVEPGPSPDELKDSSYAFRDSEIIYTKKISEERKNPNPSPPVFDEDVESESIELSNIEEEEESKVLNKSTSKPSSTRTVAPNKSAPVPIKSTPAKKK